MATAMTGYVVGEDSSERAIQRYLMRLRAHHHELSTGRGRQGLAVPTLNTADGALVKGAPATEPAADAQLPRILITGVAGFIGSHVAEAMLHRGFYVVGIDNFDPYYDPAIKRANVRAVAKHPRFTLTEGDILSAACLDEAFEHGPFGAVIHLAAKAGVRPSLSDPSLYEAVNVGGTIGLLRRLTSQSAMHIVFGSSSSVYGTDTKPPFEETASADRPASPYAATKRSAELQLHAYHHIYGFPVTCLRFFTVYGPRQRPEMAIHFFTRLIAEGKPVPMYGDGTSLRDYTFIDDIVAGIVRAVVTPSGYRIFNLGTTQTTRLRDLMELIAKYLGKPLYIQQFPEQSGDVPLTIADISRAVTELGYKPTIPLSVGLRRFVDWYLSQEERPG